MYAESESCEHIKIYYFYPISFLWKAPTHIHHKNTLTFMQVNVHAEPDAQSEGVNANLSWCKDTGGHLQIIKTLALRATI